MPTIKTTILRILLMTVLLATATACVYRIDVQQGNLLEQKDIEAVQPGMTRSQVRFLLGTPVIEDTFNQERWDYMYFFRKGRSNNAERQWLIVWFDGDRVREIQRDVPVDPV